MTGEPDPLHPLVEPHAAGLLDVGGGQRMHWETLGAPDGRPALVLHGGPGSGTSLGERRLFDPRRYRIVVMDQRGTGLSVPSAADPTTDLSVNTTWHLLADIERLRAHLGIQRWSVLGFSWGATLAILYAEQHPDLVDALFLGAVTNTRQWEIDWMYRGGVAALLPAQWERFLAGVPEHLRADPLEAYSALVNDSDPDARQRAADEWCRWELSYIDPEPEEDPFHGRFADPRYRMTFARVVTHYFRHRAWLDDGQLLRDAGRLAGIPGFMVHGRLDIGSPLRTAWEMHRAWPGSDLAVVNDPGHASTGMFAGIVRATDSFAVT